MAEPTPNVDLLRRTLAHIEAHPEEWVQTIWRCRTGMCFAGHAATLDGGTWEDGLSDQMIAVEADDRDQVWSFMGGPLTIAVEHRAQRILGLTEDQADELFEGHRTLDDLRRIVAEIADEVSPS